MDGEVGVVEENHRRSLSVGELSKRRQEIGIAVGVEVFAGIGISGTSHTARFHGAGGDPASRAPGPGGRVMKGRAPIEDLGEGFGYRVAGAISASPATA